MENDDFKMKLSKVPELTFLFWIIKVAATTLGETGGDAVSMSMNLGYLVGTLIFGAIFLIAVTIQIKVPRFHPVIYWGTIIATTTLVRHSLTLPIVLWGSVMRVALPFSQFY